MALTMLLLGCIWSGDAVIVKRYAGSKEALSNRHIECCSSNVTDSLGTLKRLERRSVTSVTNVYSSLIYGVSAYYIPRRHELTTTFVRSSATTGIPLLLCAGDDNPAESSSDEALSTYCLCGTPL
jgi:hypothetical protein